MRHVLRNEFFGGLMYDKKQKDYYYLDHLAVRILRDPHSPLSPAELQHFDAEPEEIEEVKSELYSLDAFGDVHFRNNDIIDRMLSAPVRIFYEITYRCPESCEHCYTESAEKDENELSLAEKLVLIDQMVSMGCFRVSIAGGEPLIDPDFFPFVEYALEHDIDVSFSTNGTAITAKVAKRLAGLDIRTINVSLDGWDDESFGMVRGKGRLKFVLRGLSNLREFYTGKIAAKCTLMRTNIRNLDKIIKLAEELGLDVVKFNCVREAGRAQGQDLAPTQDEYIDTMKYLARLYDEGATKIKMVLPVNPYQHLKESNINAIDELGFGCYAGKESFCVTPVGDITPCSSFGRGQYTDGNLRTRTFIDSWINGPSMRLFRGLDGSDDCKGCSSYAGCRGGCYLRSLRATGSLNDTDPYCYERKNLPISGKYQGRRSLPVLPSVMSGSV
jgi:radical SAM protein with 4Fe4S-binding SPASM domain